MANEKTTITNPRRAFLFETVNVDQLKGLEIGALTDPLVTKEELNDRGEIFYLDHLSTNELKEKYADDPSVDVKKIVPVDFVCPDGDIVEATSGNKFNYIIASHVIEHTPNFLQFLANAHEILKPGGHLILVIPDKRFTFDVNRPVTTFGTVLEKFFGKQTTPNLSAVYDHFAMATKVEGHNIWYGIATAGDDSLLISEDFAWHAACRVRDENKYYDVHTNIFTPHSFFEILKKAIRHDIISFGVSDFEDTKPGRIEFMVALKKPSKANEITKKLVCLESVPSISLDSLLSPYMPQVKSLSFSVEELTKTNTILQKELETLRRDIVTKGHAHNNLQDQLNAAKATLNRRSVRFTLAVIERISKLVGR